MLFLIVLVSIWTFFPCYCQFSHRKLEFLKQFLIFFHLGEPLLYVGCKAYVCVLEEGDAFILELSK